MQSRDRLIVALVAPRDDILALSMRCAAQWGAFQIGLAGIRRKRAGARA